MQDPNPAFMSEEEQLEEWGEVCSYCGYREAHHPVEHAELRDKSGYLCKEAIDDE